DWRRPLFPLISLLLTMTCAEVWGLQPAGNMELARDYFESGNYSQAKIVYEGLLDDRLVPWKKEILDYNIATTLLAEGNWEESALGLEALADKNISLPQLKQRVLSNLALAKTGQLESHLSALIENGKLSHEDYHLLYVYFREVLAAIAQAETAGCALEKIEGRLDCSESLYLNEMRLEVKNRFNLFLEDYSTFRLAHLSFQEGISAMLIGEKSLMNQLEVFQENHLAENLREKYLADYLKQGNSWKPFLDQLVETQKSRAKEANATDQRDLLGKSKQGFLNSLLLAEKGDFQESMKQLDESRSGFITLLQKFISQSSAREVLQQLLITYGWALVKDPIQSVPLAQILEIQTSLEPTIKQNVDALLLEDYQKAQNYLTQSVQSLDESHPIKARLFAEVARFYIQGLLEQIDFTPKTQATTVLENAIAKQQFILLLNHLRDQVQESEKGITDIDHLMGELQISTLNAADQFPEVVLVHQIESFSAMGNEASRCQCQPWDEVIPLFSEGYSKAELAERYMKIDNFKDGTAVQALQKTAIEKWKEALAKMRSKSSSKKESSQEEKQQENKPQSKDQSMDKQQQDTKLNEILRRVQEMENDDRSTPQQVKTISGSTKGEERPW
ncbi:MAG TPA: hypothetical protein VGP47_03260, partial [Parachlamydiaceae bacterium]|nr:hypothetical protein [Parachlamydiaceae bacterium]